MKTTKSYILFIIILYIMALNNAIGQEKKTISFKEELTIGKLEGDENYLIGTIADLKVDNKGDLYILDVAFKKVRKYSKKGIHIKDYGKGEGDGPGEFRFPRGMDIDRKGNVYITDMKKNTIIIYDKNGKLLTEYKLNYSPTFIVALSMSEVYVTHFYNTLNNKMIYKYDLTQKKDDMCIKEFGDPINVSQDNKNILMRSGMGPILFKDNEYIYLSEFIPHIIRKYDNEGNLIKEYKKELSFIKYPSLAKTPNGHQFYKINSGSLASFVVDNRFLFSLILNVIDNSIKQYYSVWDIKNDEFKGLFDEKDVNIKFNRYATGDSFGNIYMLGEGNGRVPLIFKYKLILK